MKLNKLYESKEFDLMITMMSLLDPQLFIDIVGPPEIIGYFWDTDIHDKNPPDVWRLNNLDHRGSKEQGLSDEEIIRRDVLIKKLVESFASNTNYSEEWISKIINLPENILIQKLRIILSTPCGGEVGSCPIDNDLRDIKLLQKPTLHWSKPPLWVRDEAIKQLNPNGIHPTIYCWFTAYAKSSSLDDVCGSIFDKSMEECLHDGTLYLRHLSAKDPNQRLNRKFSENTMKLNSLNGTLHESKALTFQIWYIHKREPGYEIITAKDEQEAIREVKFLFNNDVQITKVKQIG